MYHSIGCDKFTYDQNMNYATLRFSEQAII